MVRDIRRQEKRDALLRAAVDLFARNGYDATAVSAIAERAGVSHGTVFLYFPSKEALFADAVLEPLKEFVDRSYEILDGPGSPVARIRRLVRTQMNEAATDRAYMLLVGSAMAQAERFGDLAQQVTHLVDRFVVRLAEVVTEGIASAELAGGSPLAIAASYISYLSGVGLVVLHADAETWDQLVNQGLRLFALSEGLHHDD